MTVREGEIMLWLLAAVGTAICFGINNTLFKWGTTKHVSKVMTQLFFYLIAFFIMFLFAFVRHGLD
jgi:drug/metabolite transporter (DMT)-like permease